jgi:hypothetical protein
MKAIKGAEPALVESSNSTRSLLRPVLSRRLVSLLTVCKDLALGEMKD